MFPVKKENYEENTSSKKEEIKVVESAKKENYPRQKLVEKENSESKLVKNILNSNDVSNFVKSGLWTCQFCPESKFLFIFELFQHWRESHPKDFAVSVNSKLEDKLLEIFEKNCPGTLERDSLLFQNNYWTCPLCPKQDKFVHKCQLISHWFESHSNAEKTYEACQWCMELFTSPKHSEQVIYFCTILLNITYFRGIICFLGLHPITLIT